MIPLILNECLNPYDPQILNDPPIVNDPPKSECKASEDFVLFTVNLFWNVYSKRGDEIYYLQTKYIAGNTQNMEIPTVYEVYECIQTAVIHLG